MVLLVVSEPIHPDRRPGRRIVDFLDFPGTRVAQDDFLVNSSKTQKPIVGSQMEKRDKWTPSSSVAENVASLSSSSFLWKSRWDLTKSGEEIIASHAFDTHWKRIKGFTGSLGRTSENMRIEKRDKWSPSPVVENMARLSSSSFLWRSRWVSTKSGDEIIASHAFETHWKRIRVSPAALAERQRIRGLVVDEEVASEERCLLCGD
nr:hypothetical protein Iba_chr12dCG3820 [Ipomoea batatas]